MTPNSIFALCDTPLYNISNVLSFASRNAQKEYFESREISESKYSDFSYVRQESVVKIPKVLDKAINANYCYFTNPYYGNKIFYAYVRKMEYISPHCTAVYIEIDPWQTYLFDIKYGQCYVEREHVSKNDDVIGRHTLSEPLPAGRLKYTLAYESRTDQDVGYLIGVKKDLNGNLIGAAGWHRSVFACGLYCETSPTNLPNTVKKLEEVESGNVLFVQSMDIKALPPHLADGKSVGVIDNGGSFMLDSTYRVGIGRPSNLDGYVPKNNKLLTYPYLYCACTTGKGDIMEYPYELFDNPDGSASFVIECECSNNPSDISVPTNFEGKTYNYDKKCLSDTYPAIPHQGDNTEYYNVAKALQASGNEIQDRSFAYNMISQTINNTVSAVKGLAGKNPNVTSGLLGQAGTMYDTFTGRDLIDMQQALDKAKLEDNYKRNARTYNGASCGSVLFQSDFFGFYYYTVTIAEEYAKVCDDFLTRYGYSCLRVKTPAINSRSNFNFVKTSGSAVYGDVPTIYLAQINNAFNNGITIWHNPTTMYDYTNNQ